MRILHCCLAAAYIDNYGYQENVLPRMHKLQGHEVAIVASTETYKSDCQLGYLEPSSYYTEDGIPITRLPYARYLPHALAIKLRIYEGLGRIIEAFSPEIIFLHDCQFLSMGTIAKYKKRHACVRIYVDGHADFENSARNWLSKHVLHGVIYKYCTKQIEPYTEKFFGVLPARVEFFSSMYDVPPEKVELLVMGADHTKVDFANKLNVRSAIRKSLNINDEDFVLVTGGKIDERKGVHNLLRAVREISNRQLKLIVFGRPTEQMKVEIEFLSDHECVRSVGWVDADKVYEYFLAADLGVFPGTHSVLWEQAVGVGLPCIFKTWKGMKHVDVGGNCRFLDIADVAEIKQQVSTVFHNKALYAKMLEVATGKGVNVFSYSEIAKRSIQE